MKRSTQRALIREAFRCLERNEPPLYGEIVRNATDAYTSPERLAREEQVLFRRYPLVVGFSSQLTAAGDFVADDLSPVPVVVVRQRSGELKAFLNVCRHRGTRLVEGSGRGTATFSCPYHGWSYETDGSLRAIPDEIGFAGIDRRAYGLVELAVEEKYGLIWVLPSPGAAFRIDEHLDGLVEDLGEYGFDRYRLQATRRLRNLLNWKLASDTFWEAYHLKVLHRKTVASLFLRNLGLFEPFGTNHRLVGVRRSILELRDRPEDEWELIPHATILMNLFPNTVLIMQTDHAEAYRIFPVPGRVDESVTEVSILAPGDPDPEWDRTMDLVVGVISEDYAVSEGIQRNFAAGAIPEVTYGRYEPALAHFHRSLREALGAHGT